MPHAIITGSTRGIGFALATEFLNRNWTVTVNGTSEQSILKAKEQLLGKFSESNIHFCKAKVNILSEVENLWNESLQRFGAVDIWVNNAGVSNSQHVVHELTATEIQSIVDINISGLINGTVTAYQGMSKQGFGKIFNMEGFGSSNMMRPKMTMYGMSKRAVRYFTHSYEKEIAGGKVLLGTISPGMVVTDLVTGKLPDDPKERAQTIKIFNILGNKPEPVAKFLVEGMIACKKHSARIHWLSTGKAMSRFLTAPFSKRNLFPDVNQ